MEGGGARGGSGGSPVVDHRPGGQWCNRRPLSSSWTGASDSLHWTAGSWRWGGPWEEDVVVVGNGVKVGGGLDEISEAGG